MCRPKAPHFSASAAPKDSTVSTWTAPKDPPFQKYTFVCSTFPTWAAPKDPTFKSLRFFVIFSSTLPPPSFFIEGRSESPPFSVRGPLPKLPKLWAAHTYIYIYIYIYIYHFNEFSFVFLSFLYVCLSNKGHLLMSFPSLFFRFCLCVCLSNKGHLLMFFFLRFGLPGVCGGGGVGYSHIRALLVCAARNPRPPHPIFRPGPLLKTPPFRPGPHRKIPLFKNIH